MEASGIWFEALVRVLGSLAVVITISAAALVIDYRSGRLGSRVASRNRRG